MIWQTIFLEKPMVDEREEAERTEHFRNAFSNYMAVIDGPFEKKLDKADEGLDKFCHRLFSLTKQFLADPHRRNKKIVVRAAS